jgi:hypothetical protein
MWNALSKAKSVRGVILGAATAFVILYLAGMYSEVRSLSSPTTGPKTPGTLGVPFERILFLSHGRRLHGYVVHAGKDGEAERAVLIFHGAGENIADWVLSQKLLREGGVSSMVFDYSGNGDSSGLATRGNLDEDARSAYRAFVAQFPVAHTRAVMGFSMGNAPLLDALPDLSPAPSRIVLAAAFSSVRDLVHYTFGVPTILCALLPDRWNNVRAARRIRIPVLVLHSQDDRANPIWMGARIFAAIPAQKQMVTLRGFPHNGYSKPGWWTPVISFLVQ